MPATSVLHILRTIKDRASISRTELQQVSGLSWGTVTNTTRELITRKLIREEGAQSTRAGRKPVRLALDAQGHGLIGCAFTEASIRCLAVTLTGQILSEEALTIHAGDGGVPRARVAELIRRAQQAAGERHVVGAGLSVEASADTPHAWNDLRKALENQLNMPVFMQRHAASLALAERWFGAAQADDLLCIELGPSVSLGMLLEGEPFRAATGMGGQFGHFSVDPNGPACPCGSRGCVNSYCSTAALLAYARDAGVNATPATMEDLAALAVGGNAAARGAFERLGKYLALAINNVVRLFEPGQVVLAGTSSVAASVFMPALERHLTRRGDFGAVPIVISQLGSRAAALGAAAAILQKTFSPETA